MNVHTGEKNAADKTLGNRALSVAAGSRSVPAGAYPRIRGTVPAVDGSHSLPECRRCFFGRGPHTAKHSPHGLPAKQNDREGKAGETFL